MAKKAKEDNIEDKENKNRKKSVYDFESDSRDFFESSVDTKSKRKKYEVEEDDDEEEEEEEDEEIIESKGRIFKIVLFCIIMAVAFALIWAFNSPTFIIEEVEIHGYDLNSYYEVCMLSQGLEGNNIFTKDLEALRKQILSIPYVKNAEVKRVLPNKVEISFEERVPFILVAKDGQFIVLDQEGYVIEIDFVDNVYDIPTATGLIEDYELSGDKISNIDLIKLKNIVYLMKSMDNINFEYKVNNINYSKIEGISFKVEGTNLGVRYGDLIKEQTNDKLIYLKEIIKKSVEQGFSGTIDITSEKYNEKTVLINNY